MNNNLLADGHELIIEVPKVLLHTHLEGSIPQSTLLKLCKRNKIVLPFPFDSKAVKEICRKGRWDTFLRLYLLISSCFMNRLDFYDAICDYADCLYKENIIYAELTCTPWNHYSRGVALDDIALGLYDGIEAARKKYGIDLKIIFDVNKIAAYYGNTPGYSFTKKHS